MRNIFIGPHVINITALTEAELEKLGKELEASLDEIDEALNKTQEDESYPNGGYLPNSA